MAHSKIPSDVMLVPADNLDRIALFLSKLFSPLFGFIGGYTVVVLAAQDQRAVLGWAMLSMGIQIIPTLILYRMYYGAPASITQVALSFFLIGAACGVINVWWKISMHASAIAAVATIATMQSRSLGMVFWMVVAMVAWSRLRTRNHSSGQVAAGTVLATMVVYVVHRYIA